MKYASVGANGLGLPLIFDGLNEKGLAIGLFYFPATAGYMPYRLPDAGKTIAPWEMGSWILDNFSTVEEVKANASQIVVAEVVFKGWGFVPPVHFVVTDASGKSIVIEYVGGKLNVHENPLGVMTNSPTFDWHMTNLRNYVKFSPATILRCNWGPSSWFRSAKVRECSDFRGTSPRLALLVHAVAFSQSLLPSKTGTAAVSQAFHVLNNFDLPKGALREDAKDDHGNILADYTIWTSANDLKAKRFYFRTYQQPDSDGRSDEDEPRRQGPHQKLHAGRRGHQVTEPVMS